MSSRVIGKPKKDNLLDSAPNPPSRLRPHPSHSLPTSPSPNGLPTSSTVATSGSWEGMVCPICGMTTNNLMDLNKHLDQEHAEEDIPQVIFNWFKAAPKKLLTPLSNSLKSTNNFQKLQRMATGSPTIHQMDQFIEPTESQVKIRKEHWDVGYDGMECNQLGCSRSLGLLNGRINCRKCGRLYCDQHVNYQVKLNIEADYDSENGEYFKTCLSCFQNRPHYNETEGVTRNWSERLMKLRKQEVDKVHLEVNRLEKRLEKLAKVHGSQRNSTYLFNSLPKISSNFRETEKMIVEWEDDEKVTNCPYCYKKFGKMTNRRHHCRVCGKIVCGQNTCSSKLTLNSLWLFEEESGNPQIDVIVCRDCVDKVLKRDEIKKQESSIQPVAKLYPTLKRHKEIILKTLPKFNEIVFALRNNTTLLETSEDYQHSVKLRRDLMESFTSFDSINKKIRDIPSNSQIQKRVHQSIYSAGHLFLQTYMLSLSLLPRPTQNESPKPPLPSRKLTKAGSSPRSNTGSPQPVPNAETIELNIQAIEYRNQLTVFREQIDQLKLLQQEATKHRKLEDYQSLENSIQELNEEIKMIKDKLKNLKS